MLMNVYGNSKGKQKISQQFNKSFSQLLQLTQFCLGDMAYNLDTVSFIFLQRVSVLDPTTDMN